MTEQTSTPPLWQLPGTELTAKVLACEEKLRRTHAEILALTSEIDQRGLARSLGYKDSAALLTETLRISSREATLRLTQAKATMPASSITGQPTPPPQAATGEALTAGTINREHVQAITALFHTCPSEITPEQRAEDETVLLRLAEQAGPDAVRKACRRLHSYWEQETTPPDAKPEQARPLRRLEITRRSDGSARFAGELDAETAEILDGLMGPLATPCPNPATKEADLRSPAERRGDALADIIALAARSDELSTQGGERAVMIVTTTLQELEGRTRDALLTIPGLTSLDTLRHLACNAKAVPAIFDATGEPLYLGRATRFATAAQRHALVLRDGGCAFPGCTRKPKWCTPHHILPWWLGGPTNVDNLVLLCGRHHRLIHHSLWEIWMVNHQPQFIPPAWLDSQQKPLINHAHGHSPPGQRTQHGN